MSLLLSLLGPLFSYLCPKNATTPTRTRIHKPQPATNRYLLVVVHYAYTTTTHSNAMMVRSIPRQSRPKSRVRAGRLELARTCRVVFRNSARIRATGNGHHSAIVLLIGASLCASANTAHLCLFHLSWPRSAQLILNETNSRHRTVNLELISSLVAIHCSMFNDRRLQPLLCSREHEAYVAHLVCKVGQVAVS